MAESTAAPPAAAVPATEAIGVKKPMLASIQVVTDIRPIEGADRILKATVLGWETVIKRDEFKDGDLCVWHEPDTVVDKTNPVYVILEKREYRLRISRIRGQISQGLALPIHHFKEQLAGIEPIVGTDVTEQVNILHWTKPTTGFTKNDRLTNWPSFLRKTDQPNLRSKPKALELLRAEPEVAFTLKMDGTSATFYHFNTRWGLCSRNYELVFDPEKELSHYRKIANKHALEHRMVKYGKDIAIQGEICGPEVNRNPAGLKELTFYVFHIWDIRARRMVDFDDMLKMIEEINALELDPEFAAAPKLQTVPILQRGPIGERTLADLITYTNSLTYAPGKLAEGVVIHPVKEVPYVKYLDERLSVKLISEPFELKHGW